MSIKATIIVVDGASEADKYKEASRIRDYIAPIVSDSVIDVTIIERLNVPTNSSEFEDYRNALLEKANNMVNYPKLGIAAITTQGIASLAALNKAINGKSYIKTFSEALKDFPHEFITATGIVLYSSDEAISPAIRRSYEEVENIVLNGRELNHRLFNNRDYESEVINYIVRDAFGFEQDYDDTPSSIVKRVYYAEPVYVNKATIRLFRKYLQHLQRKTKLSLKTR